ncbi:unnamed protein product [Cylicocyclus nassatus]|uniref:7TM GPCR serpentine receptor class x (Srx) domain-containing protein n=1 Tax=Cylicocyclus nassatus TaxID=53992 RepID=A0AA36DLB8_CYLNA|nr:unnamed protein product [Cylicocyclus nassatus]
MLRFSAHCRVFSRNNTLILIAFIWAASIFPPLYLFGYLDCKFIYRDDIFALVFLENKTCDVISWYLDALKSLIVVSIITVVDFITVVIVRSRVKAQTQGASRTGTSLNEINLLKQAIARGLLFVTELFSYFCLASRFENRWAVWAFSTVAWNILHLCDPIVVITFNKEFRKLIVSFHMKMTKCSTISSSATAYDYTANPNYKPTYNYGPRRSAPTIILS